MIKYEGVASWPPSHKILLASDISVGGVQDSSLPPLQPGTALYPPSQDHLVHSGQTVRLRVPECSLEQVFQPRPQPPVSAVHNHGEVLGDDGWLGAALQLQCTDCLMIGG